MAQLTIQEAFDLAVQRHRAGGLQQAETIYRQILAHEPRHFNALHLLGVLAFQTGRHDMAVDLIRQALVIAPASGGAHYNLGNALRDGGHLEAAVAAYRQAIVLEPKLREVYGNLGNILRDLGQMDEAIALAQREVALFPDSGGSHVNLGNALKQKGRADEAIAAYRQAVRLDPNLASAHGNLGVVLSEQGKTNEAITALRTAAALDNRSPEVRFNLGKALAEIGSHDEAIIAYRQAIALRPRYAQAHSNLGSSLSNRGDLQEAVAALRQAIAIDAGFAGAWCNLGAALRAMGQLDESIFASRRAVDLKASVESCINLGNALGDKGHADEAIMAYRRAVTLEPDSARACNNLGWALKDTGRHDEAIALFRHGIRLNPNASDAHGNLLFSLHYHPDYDAHAIAAEHRQWNLQHAEPLAKLIRVHTNDRSPQRRLRIGYVSADLRDHVVGRNVLPLFKHHNHERFEIICYSLVPSPDAMTRQFQQLADSWRNIAGVSDEQAAEQIRADQIDILVDLGLHTAGHRLLVFARKPAPVQLSFAGYPGSTGLTAIDYRLSDPFLDPVGMDESIYSEKTLRLPHSFWCFDPLEDADLAVNALPALSTGVFTFGCRNAFCKINDRVLELWARVLSQVADSRLLLLASEGEHRGRLQRFLEDCGIHRSRVEFTPRETRRKYLEAFHRIDICLDTFPYNGHTTSLDSFWMGVPVVTLVGQTAVARAGWCQLSNLGLTELAANDAESFVRIAVELATDLPRLQQLRGSLRTRMEQSPLMDATNFARDIEAVYRRIWETWCRS